MTELIFAIGLIFGLTLNALLLATQLVPEFRLWPAPEPGSWQSRTFWTLFRGGMVLTFATGLLDWNAVPLLNETRFFIGVPLFVAGFGICIAGYFNLGLGNTYCGSDGLVTGGLYNISRNPQYTFSILGLIGLAIFANSYLTIVLCVVMSAAYVQMALTEELWLRKLYGATYDAYCAKTSRFLDIQALLGLKPKAPAGDAG
ncbi:PEMT/PEM2 methyltransferase family protein [Methyloligella sp. 2.7D]|uniref:methyltransferase family protein n=1 Tax=unclassified Methyloligella TaxID=2625955 RepID=UPI00157D75F1|nr:PEMT/PEM2 methyltransferase family protein [Methyloligella sp. GL2]QKP77159.1 heavy metal resistance protein CzcN [Methyloligella sp. GL2]